MRALLLAVTVGTCSTEPAGPPSNATDGYELRGTGCRRVLLRNGEKLCDAVVVSRGKDSCEQVSSLSPDVNGLPRNEAEYGSGCRSGTQRLAGRLGNELYFWQDQGSGEGFIVLCDHAKVDHIDEFADAKVRCFERTK